MSQCLTCGGEKPEYSKEFLKLWRAAYRVFPLYALPEIKFCNECLLHKYGWHVSGAFKARREAWLRSGLAPVASIDMKDPEQRRKLRKSAVEGRKYRALVEKQKRKKAKLRVKKFWRKWKRGEKARLRRIEDVLDTAVQLGVLEEQQDG